MFFVYTRYKNSIMATMVSALGAGFMAGGVVLVVTGIMEGEDVRPTLLIGASFLGIGWLISKGAEKIAVRKERKKLAMDREKRAAEIAKADPIREETVRTAAKARVCGSCGTALEEGDMFCYRCGRKL